MPYRIKRKIADGPWQEQPTDYGTVRAALIAARDDADDEGDALLAAQTIMSYKTTTTRKPAYPDYPDPINGERAEVEFSCIDEHHRHYRIIEV